MTPLSSDKESLLRPESSARSKGQHFSCQVENSATELQDPPFLSKQRACVTFSKFINDPKVNIEEYFRSVHDRSMN